MKRTVQPEILDSLPANDPAAIHSRRDLRRVNRVMGHARLFIRELRQSEAPRHVVELGAGDGSLLLRVARRLPRPAGRTRATLVDLQPTLGAETRTAFDALGWDVEPVEADVFEWLSRPGAETADLALANLFLHHFREPDLATFFALLSRQTRKFIACEPRRSPTALAGASLLALLGANSVTRHDARISVRAGFCDAELSRLWPADAGWQLTESGAGLFTHFFAASRGER